ncbi:hypothetical protein NLJ89_g6178 [Agrocybe chaxingu]|uniref:Uncharacterized protein n=1 Tax=Agrocybe chaxingu TaxID=84603 RepID=A0A9W8JZM2_9AGAR|nr:hypothetical protein NLJ89_g6178 [Agrocybe chaxingu]
MAHRARAAPSLRDRSALLGATNTATTTRTSTPPASGRSTPFGGSVYHPNPNGNGNAYQPNGHRYADDLEGQNDEALEGLSAKVKLLKDVHYYWNRKRGPGFDNPAQPMNDAFAETGGILSGTFRRMNNMAARQGCRWLWYIVFLVIVFWFFMVVWWFRR